MERLRPVVLERLIQYYRYLFRLTTQKSMKTITSAQLGTALDIDPTQVRKDFGAIGLVGISRVGYEICEVCRAIRMVFGFDRPYQAILVGSGHLGKAILNYPGFARYGLQIVAAFDKDPEIIGTEIAGLRIRHIRSLKPFLRNRDVRMAILTTPVGVSQGLADRLASSGIKAIWNFSPTRLTAPPDVLIRNQYISVGLAQLAYHLSGSSSAGSLNLPALHEPCDAPCIPPDTK